MFKEKEIFKNFVNIYFLLFIVVLSGSEVFAQRIGKIQGHVNHVAKEKKKMQDSTKTNKGRIIPVPNIITDQNLGFGAVLALGYVHDRKNTTKKDTPPTISGIAGGYTSTGTWLVGIGHSESFKNDQYRYVGFAAYANVNMDFYKLGGIDLSDRPIGINGNGWGTVHQFLFRAGHSDFFIGPQYKFFQIETSVQTKDKDHPRIDDLLDKIDKKEIFSSIGLLTNFDQRDNTISPVKGSYAGVEFDFNATFLGATQNFQQLDLFAYEYVPINKWLYSIFHFDYQLVGGDVPFYVKPYLDLRGVPMMRYQGNNTILLEAQFRGYFYKNWALVAFGGMGEAFDSFSEFNSDDLVFNVGTGFRYNMKKMFGLRVGADFAWAGDDFGWYISIGTGL